jgi:hypothetical protein
MEAEIFFDNLLYRRTYGVTFEKTTALVKSEGFFFRKNYIKTFTIVPPFQPYRSPFVSACTPFHLMLRYSRCEIDGQNLFHTRLYPQWVSKLSLAALPSSSAGLKFNFVTFRSERDGRQASRSNTSKARERQLEISYLILPPDRAHTTVLGKAWLGKKLPPLRLCLYVCPW